MVNDSRARPVASLLAGAACAAVFAAECLAGAAGSEPRLLPFGALRLSEVLAGQPWRLLTFWWLHLDLQHLVMNMTALAIFAPPLERAVGWRRFATLYLAGGLASGVAALLANAWQDRNPITEGASGALWGVMAAVLLLGFLGGPRHIPGWARTAALVVLALGTAASLLPGVSLAGHLGGGLAGAALALLWTRRPLASAPLCLAA